MTMVSIPMCDFCGRTNREVQFMASGNDEKVHICEFCINAAKEKVDASRAQAAAESQPAEPAPVEEPEAQPEPVDADPIEVDAEVIGE